ncbi:hypothetical protein R3W88_029128 [Solanum pinnatisectum]|uniref:Pectinesterase inhibitor domain-containing protein n=1 Tax=Solanum pinnatisectum TaxID=50273 RepID=A0AAV9K4H0_9SOLN|nr:hypothetical protein R3W88_029128 [Solanum pinnatisectum]
MASLFTSYFLPLVLVANIFNFQTSLCDISADEALIAEVTRAAIAQSLQNANNNHAFITQDLYAICDVGYGLMITILQDAAQSLANKNYIALENDLSKCPRFVSDCQNALGSKTTPEMLDRSRKQFDLVIMSQIAEGLIKK